MDKPEAAAQQARGALRNQSGGTCSEDGGVTGTSWPGPPRPTACFGQCPTGHNSRPADPTAAQSRGLGLPPAALLVLPTDPQPTGQAVPNSLRPEKMVLELKQTQVFPDPSPASSVMTNGHSVPRMWAFVVFINKSNPCS